MYKVKKDRMRGKVCSIREIKSNREILVHDDDADDQRTNHRIHSHSDKCLLEANCCEAFWAADEPGTNFLVMISNTGSLDLEITRYSFYLPETLQGSCDCIHARGGCCGSDVLKKTVRLATLSRASASDDGRPLNFGLPSVQWFSMRRPGALGTLILKTCAS